MGPSGIGLSIQEFSNLAPSTLTSHLLGEMKRYEEILKLEGSVSSNASNQERNWIRDPKIQKFLNPFRTALQAKISKDLSENNFNSATQKMRLLAYLGDASTIPFFQSIQSSVRSVQYDIERCIQYVNATLKIRNDLRTENSTFISPSTPVFDQSEFVRDLKGFGENVRIDLDGNHSALNVHLVKDPSDSRFYVEKHHVLLRADKPDEFQKILELRLAKEYLANIFLRRAGIHVPRAWLYRDHENKLVLRQEYIEDQTTFTNFRNSGNSPTAQMKMEIAQLTLASVSIFSEDVQGSNILVSGIGELNKTENADHLKIFGIDFESSFVFPKDFGSTLFDLLTHGTSSAKYNRFSYYRFADGFGEDDPTYVFALRKLAMSLVGISATEFQKMVTHAFDLVDVDSSQMESLVRNWDYSRKIVAIAYRVPYNQDEESIPHAKLPSRNPASSSS